MGLHEPPRDREPEAGVGPAASPIAAEKRLEHVRQVLSGEPRPVVDYVDGDGAVDARSVDGDVRAVTADAQKLATCLRAQHLASPTDPVQLTARIARQDKAAIEQALNDCGATGPEPACGPKPADREKIAASNEDDQ